MQKKDTKLHYNAGCKSRKEAQKTDRISRGHTLLSFGPTEDLHCIASKRQTTFSTYVLHPALPLFLVQTLYPAFISVMVIVAEDLQDPLWILYFLLTFQILPQIQPTEKTFYLEVFSLKVHVFMAFYLHIKLTLKYVFMFIHFAFPFCFSRI